MNQFFIYQPHSWVQINATGHSDTVKTHGAFRTSRTACLCRESGNSLHLLTAALHATTHTAHKPLLTPPPRLPRHCWQGYAAREEVVPLSDERGCFDLTLQTSVCVSPASSLVAAPSHSLLCFEFQSLSTNQLKGSSLWFNYHLS